MRLTVQEVAEKLSVERETARGLVKFLVEVGLAKLKGEREPENGRGASQKVYQFEDGYVRALSSMLSRAKLS